MNVGRYMSGFKKLCDKIGVDVRSNHHLFARRFVKHVNQKGINLIVDVGANKGQFAESMFSSGYKGTIISFEPLPDACKILNEKSKSYNGKWIIAAPTALSNVNGSTEFNYFSSDAMSSLLDPSDTMARNVANVAVKEKIKVELNLLSEILWETAKLPPQEFALKIDTQGSELQVLKGAEKLFKFSRLVQFETSTDPNYQEQPYYFELDNYMRDFGFKLIDLEPGYRNATNGKMLEFDTIYENIAPE